jgi:HD superfamily phosphodiesterase
MVRDTEWSAESHCSVTIAAWARELTVPAGPLQRILHYCALDRAGEAVMKPSWIGHGHPIFTQQQRNSGSPLLRVRCSAGDEDAARAHLGDARRLLKLMLALATKERRGESAWKNGPNP